MVPCAAMSRTIGSSCSTIAGARPSDSSSIMSRRGFSMNAMPSASICCWPPERLPAGSSSRFRRMGKSSSTWFCRFGHQLLVVAVQPTREPEVLRDGQRREHAVAAGHLHHAASGDLVRRCVRHVATIEHDRAVRRLDETGDRLQQGRLPRAVRAEQRDDLALVDLEVHAEQDLHAVVVHVDVAHEQELHLALPALEHHLGLRGGRRPHAVDVAADVDRS